MAKSNISPIFSGPKRTPKIVLLLDDETRVLNVNRCLAGTSFALVSDSNDEPLHQQLHPNCDGMCRLSEMWIKARSSLMTRDSVEWEVDDPELGRLLRLNLAKTPTPKSLIRDRRQRHMLLTITDITKYRHEYESLIEKQQALVKLLIAKNASAIKPDEQAFDETGDTGNRLMAGFAKSDRSVRRQMMLAQESERRRIASELHDGIAQTIGVVKYRIEAGVASLLQQNPELDLQVFESAIEEIKNLVNEIRRISNNLAPSILDDFGIRVALEWLCRECTTGDCRAYAHCATDLDEGATPNLVKLAIYRVAQEALNNVVKHSGATRVDVSLESTGKGVRLLVSDNGIGFCQKEQQSGPGSRSGHELRSMRERVEATGGNFDFEAEKGKGVVVRAEWDDAELGSIPE